MLVADVIARFLGTCMLSLRIIDGLGFWMILIWAYMQGDLGDDRYWNSFDFLMLLLSLADLVLTYIVKAVLPTGDGQQGAWLEHWHGQV